MDASFALIRRKKRNQKQFGFKSKVMILFLVYQKKNISFNVVKSALENDNSNIAVICSVRRIWVGGFCCGYNICRCCSVQKHPSQRALSSASSHCRRHSTTLMGGKTPAAVMPYLHRERGRGIKPLILYNSSPSTVENFQFRKTHK